MSETALRLTDVPIDESKPWAAWQEPIVVETNLSELRVEMIDNMPRAADDEESPGENVNRYLAFVKDGEVIGRASKHALHALSTRVSYPLEFVSKLAPDLQAAVINDRILDARSQEFALAAETDPVYEGEVLVTNCLPGWRGVCGHAQVAQVAHDYLMERLEGAEVESASCHHGEMVLRLSSPLQQPVTRRKGDVLSCGVDIYHNYGMDLRISLYARRLVCLNGMTREDRPFDWTNRDGGSEEDQLRWLRNGMDQAIESYGDLVARAHQMAETKYTGDYADAIRERARLMHIPQRHWADIISAFEEEPGDSEWHLLNAFTRFASHRAEYGLSRRLQRMAGIWVGDFDMVNARLPRPVANLVGAHILDAGAIIEQINQPPTSD